MEAWRASEDLKKQVGTETALVAINYVLPEKYGRNVFFNNRRRQQEKDIAEIKQRFKTPIFTIPLLDHEPEGLTISNSCDKTSLIDEGCENELADKKVGDKRLFKRRVSTILQI